MISGDWARCCAPCLVVTLAQGRSVRAVTRIAPRLRSKFRGWNPITWEERAMIWSLTAVWWLWLMFGGWILLAGYFLGWRLREWRLTH